MSFETYVLQVWADGDDPKDGGDAVRLLRLEDGGKLSPVASHPEGVSAETRFSYNGAEVDLSTLLAQENLLRSDLLLAVGEALYARLAQGEVGAKLADLGRSKRVMLDLKSPSLTLLPWELIRRNDFALFQIDAHPWVLGQPEVPSNPMLVGQADLSSPLRVMVVLGSKPDDEKVRGDDELRQVEDALYPCRGEMLLDVLERPGPEEILRRMEDFEPHVLHFIGHGSVVGGKAVIRVYNEATGATETWDADRIRQVLSAIRAPRLVILNACDTAGAGADGAWTLTDAFLGSGVGALLAMQAEIRGDAALAFGKRLYQGLAEGLPVDVATTRARRYLAVELGGAGTAAARANWPVPRLVVRGDPEGVVRFCGASAEGGGGLTVRAGEDFVHRWRHRRAAFEVLLPHAAAEEGPKSPRRLVLFEGPSGSGKTELLKMLGESWQRVGHRALYAMMDPHADPEPGLIVRQLAAVAEKYGLDASPLTAVDTALPSGPLFDALRKALEALAGGEPLLVLLDGFQGWPPDTVRRTLIPEIGKRWMTAPDGAVWMAAALPESFLEGFAWDGLGDGFRPIRVGHFSPREWRRAAAQFVRWHQRRFEEEMSQNPGGFSEASLPRFTENAWSHVQLKPPGEVKYDDKTAYEAKLLKYFRLLKETWI